MSRVSRKPKTNRRNTVGKGDSMSVIGQYIELATLHSGKIPLYKQNQTGEERHRTDEKVFVCTKCRIAWEAPVPGTRDDPDYYLDYPSYGKKRKDCPKCEKKK